MIKLVPIDAVRASEYNPRRNDERRLALTELSLRKLGFLLPIYADESGEILHGLPADTRGVCEREDLGRAAGCKRPVQPGHK